MLNGLSRKMARAKAIEINPELKESCRTDKKLCCYKTVYLERTEETSSRCSIECRPVSLNYEFIGLENHLNYIHKKPVPDDS